MDIKVVIALIVAIPIVLFPVAFVWFLNTSGLYAVIRAQAKKRMAKKIVVKF